MLRSLFKTMWPAALLFLAACSTTQPHAVSGHATSEPVPLLLISIDGLRADYLQRGITPHLTRLADEGVRAEWMTPSYPALTFPNHYTLVTGLRPDHHGIVHNMMTDEELGGFRLSNREAVGNGGWWGGEPIWVGAERAGLTTATLFWPGSEAPIHGLQPTYWKPFDQSMPYNARVDQVVAWLDQPAAKRPRLATLYLENLDSAGHQFGPESPQARAALVEADAAIGRLLRELTQRGGPGRVNLIVVSDHGMATVAPGHVIAIEDMVDPTDAAMVSAGQSVGFSPRPGRRTAAEARLLGQHEQYDCWRKHELPARWHYGSNARVPAIVCQMHEGWDALPRAALASRPREATRGSHGFDPALPSMRAIFIAHGPAFREGVVIPAFDNVDVYPLLARLLGITPAANDGDAQALLPALKGDAASSGLAQ